MVIDPEDMAKAVEKLRLSALFDEGDTVLGPFSEQEYMLGLAALESAKAFFVKAHYHSIRKD